MPQPLAQWEFEGNLRDSLGGLHGEAVGEVRFEDGALVLDARSGYAKTAVIEKDITVKTLEAWVVLDNAVQTGSAPISLQTTDGNTYDAITFGKGVAGAWTAGSDMDSRTQRNGGPAENTIIRNPIHLAIVYEADGSIHRYRNGVRYDEP